MCKKIKLAAMMLTCSLALANSQEDLFIRVKDAKAVYNPGETVTFEITASPSAENSVQWKLSRDGVSPSSDGTAVLSNGRAEVIGTLNSPGFLRLEVAGEKKRVTLAAAAFAPEEICPTQKEPPDFMTFWQEKVQHARGNYRQATLAPQPDAKPGVVTFDVSLETGGTPVSGYLSRPMDGKPKSLPAILTLHAAGFRSANRQISEHWASMGMLALDINAHGLPNGESAEFYAEAAKRHSAYFKQGSASREESYFTFMMLRVTQALDYLTKQPEWNGKTLVTYGYSQGGAQAIAGAALDSRVTLVVSGVPAMCEHSGILSGDPTGWPRFISLDAHSTPSAVEAETARYLDMVNFARHIKARAIFTVGFIDTTCPPTTVYAAWNTLPGEKEIMDAPTVGHGVPSSFIKRLETEVLRHAGLGN